MAYSIARNKEECRKQLVDLTTAFKMQFNTLSRKTYSEAQLRNDFLNPFLRSFGWDVENEEQKTQFLRDVIQEETIDVEEEEQLTKKNPDYTLRSFGNRQLFVEAKKVSIDITTSKTSAFQIKRYGWSANLSMSVLTNFEHLIIYDCRHKPNASDEAHVSRFKVFHFSEYINKLEEIYGYLSYESIKSGALNDIFPSESREGSTFDDFFLDSIERWRESLAINVVKNNKNITGEDINFLIQRLLNRIIFLRICEDREIEKYETLKSVSSYEELKKLFIESDKKYNSGLFDFIEDDLSLNIQIDDNILIDIFNELYYPISPYDFSVVDPTILSQIYEKYLGSRIEFSANDSISVVAEPEVAASNGVVPTPKKIVRQIVAETLDILFRRIDLKASESLKIADICCGSGTFLISLFDYLIEKRTTFLIKENISDSRRINQIDINTWRLTLTEKQDILTRNIFGVDVNPYAIEVTRFSLLLKLIENENEDTINHYLAHQNQKVLPHLYENIKCGNALLDNQYFAYDESAIENDELLFKLKPFEWEEEFPFLTETEGFDAIIGNPPYVRIQNLVKYSPEEIGYYRSNTSPYSVSKKDNFDKYYLFLERAISLLNPTGLLGYIVPHKFFIVKGGRKLRNAITEKVNIAKIIHFGVVQIFPGRSTYTAIVVLDKKARKNLHFRRVDNTKWEFSFDNTPAIKYDCKDFSDLPWVFISEAANKLFKKILAEDTVPLKEIADIPVGLQTSADKIFIFNPDKETEKSYIFSQDGINWEIEKSITLPALYDVSIRLFDTPSANAVIIFPYDITDNSAEVYSEEMMKDEFPMCWSYLNHHKSKLKKRSISGKDPLWYQYGRSQSLTKFYNTPKIIFPVLSKEQSYAYDEKDIQFTGGGNGPYYSIISTSRYSILYLLGLLSHPAIEAMVKSRASEFRGAYYSHGKQFIENLPIKVIDFEDKEEKGKHDEIARLVKNLINTKISIKSVYNAGKRAVLQRKYKQLREMLINQVNELYRIDNDGIKVVSSDQLFAAELEQE